jgi:hypothetical protein
VANGNPALKDLPAGQEFLKAFAPLEGSLILILTDNRTGAKYCDCHVKASKLMRLAYWTSVGSVQRAPDRNAQPLIHWGA